MSGGVELERRLDELYAAPPASFTKARDALARALRDAGDAEAAEAVRRRRKPTRGAWVLNQLARRHPDAIASLVDVGRALLHEQRKLLRGEAATSLRELLARQRSVLAGVTRRATSVMNELGLEPSGHDDVTRALQAALVDPEIGVRVEQGRLDKAPELTGRTPLDSTSLDDARSGGPADEDREPRSRRRPRAREVQDRARKANAREAREARDRAARAAREAREPREREARERRARQQALTAARTKLRAAETEARRRKQAADRARAEADDQLARARRLEADAATTDRAAEEARREVARLSADST